MSSIPLTPTMHSAEQLFDHKRPGQGLMPRAVDATHGVHMLAAHNAVFTDSELFSEQAWHEMLRVGINGLAAESCSTQRSCKPATSFCEEANQSCVWKPTSPGLPCHLH